MSQNTIEERVARLEQLVNRLLNAKAPESQPRQGDWRRTFGMFAGDPIMKEIIDAGNRIREEDRRNVEE
jgi:tetrahydromethanopterin S-methyltransferase subunit B